MSEREKQLLAARLRRRVGDVSNVDVSAYPDGIIFNWHNQKYRTDGVTVDDIDRNGKPYAFDTPESFLLAAIIQQPRWTRNP